MEKKKVMKKLFLKNILLENYPVKKYIFTDFHRLEKKKKNCDLFSTSCSSHYSRSLMGVFKSSNFKGQGRISVFSVAQLKTFYTLYLVFS